MADIKTKYPSTSSVAITCAIASLASDTNLLAGRAGTAIANSTDLDLDHLVSGVVTTGTSPTAGTRIEVWAYADYKRVSGTPTYPDSITGTDAAKTMTSDNVKQSALRLVATIVVDSTSDRPYAFAPVSIVALFGQVPANWGLFIVHNTAVTLNSTGGNHELHYQRIQSQTV